MAPISKVEAAQRQLDTAIELYLHEFDLLSVHTLAWAAFSVLVSYDQATNAGGVWAKHIRDNPSDATRKLANFLKHADRDAHAQVDDLTDEYTHMLLLEGCKLYYELTRTTTRPMGVFYSYDIFLDGDAQDRELDRQERKTTMPTEEEIQQETRTHLESKRQLLALARHHLTAAETTWSESPPRDYSVSDQLSAGSFEEALKATRARSTKWDKQSQ